MAVKDYSSTPSLNTSISGIAIGENAPRAGMNDALRQIMSDVKDEFERCTLSVDNFGGAVGDNATNDKTAFLNTFTAIIAKGGGTVELTPGKIYFLGDFGAGDTEVLPLSGLTNVRVKGNGATIRVNSTATGARPLLFTLRGFRNVVFENLTITDPGTVLTVDWRGVYAFYCVGDTLASQGLTLDNVKVDSGVALLFVTNSNNRIQDIEIRGNSRAQNCYYGMVFAENGHNVRARLATVDCRRSYFPYGVRGHDITIDFSHAANTPAAEAMCLVKRYSGDTGDISLTINATGSMAGYADIVRMEHQPSSGTGLIENVSVCYNLDPTLDMNTSSAANTNYGYSTSRKVTPLTLSSYTSGGTEETTTTSNVWRKISLSGNIRIAPGNQVEARVKPSTEAKIALAPGLALNPLKCSTKGAIVFRTANDREFRTLTGDLTASTLDIDLSNFDNISTSVRLVIDAMGATTGDANQNASHFEVTAFLRIPAGGPITVRGSTTNVTNSVGTAATLSALAVSGKKLQVGLTGASYALTSSFLKVETIYQDAVA